MALAPPPLPALAPPAPAPASPSRGDDADDDAGSPQRTAPYPSPSSAIAGSKRKYGCHGGREQQQQSPTSSPLLRACPDSEGPASPESEAPEAEPIHPSHQSSIAPNDAESVPPDAAAQAPTVAEPEPPLCQEQQELVDLIASGRNVFYTGSAGCGKSTVLKAAIKRLRAMGLVVHVLAPTGRAALQVNGTTSWSYMGWTPDHHKLSIKALKRLAFRYHVRRRLNSTDVLIMDEISMVENHHFERINECLKEARQWNYHTQHPFGGAQVVVTGDFCQLPPVKPFQHCIECGQEMSLDEPQIEYNCPDDHGPFREAEKWAFMSDAWEECDFTHVHLTKIHRQADQNFIQMLQKCRLGIPLSPSETTTLMNHPCNVTNATRLFSTRAEVAQVNQENFSKLRTPVVAYQALDGFVWQREEHPQLEHYNDRLSDGTLAALQDHRLERRVELRIGMLVVLQVNLDLDAGLCNGSQGIICGFEDHDPANLPKAKSFKDNDTRRRPSRRSHLVTSFRSSIGSSEFPDRGEPTDVDTHDELRERQVKSFMSGQRNKVWPRVMFHNGEKRTIYAACVVNSVGSDPPYSLLHRTQIPLVAAWAMSIHKSQGMTLDRVIVNLTRAFEEGQVYVALSRATSLEGLKVEGSPEGLAVGRGGNPDVQQFMRQYFGPELARQRLETGARSLTLQLGRPNRQAGQSWPGAADV